MDLSGCYCFPTTRKALCDGCSIALNSCATDYRSKNTASDIINGMKFPQQGILTPEQDNF